MKNTLLILVALSCAACAYKPTTLYNIFHTPSMKNCYELGNGVSNSQKIFYKIKDEFAKYPGEKELRDFYLLDQYIPLNTENCEGNVFKLENIETERLLFTDTGKSKYGIQITAAVSVNNNGLIIQKEFKVRAIGEFHSTLTLTKEKIDRLIKNLLIEAYSDLDQQISRI